MCMPVCFCELIDDDDDDDKGSSELCSNFTVISAISNCSFPFTYNGGLYYSCIENIQEVSTTEQPLACVNFAGVPVVCNSPGL